MNIKTQKDEIFTDKNIRRSVAFYFREKQRLKEYAQKTVNMAERAIEELKADTDHPNRLSLMEKIYDSIWLIAVDADDNTFLNDCCDFYRSELHNALKSLEILYTVSLFTEDQLSLMKFYSEYFEEYNTQKIEEKL